jgi:hypothetical protein
MVPPQTVHGITCYAIGSTPQSTRVILAAIETHSVNLLNDEYRFGNE